MGEANERQAHRVEAHHLRRHGVHGDRIGAGQDDILDVRPHGPRPRPIARDRAVHHGEHAGVNLLLDAQEVDQRFVDDRVRPVPAVVQQPPEGVLHRAGHGGEDVRLERGHMDDVRAEEHLRHFDAVREHLVEDEHLALRRVRHPFGALVLEVDALHAVLFEHLVVLVAAFAVVRIDDHGAVLDGRNAVVTGVLQRLGDAVELPRAGAAAGVVVLPADVYLEQRLAGLRQVVAEIREFHHAAEVIKDGWGARVEHRDQRFVSRRALCARAGGCFKRHASSLSQPSQRRRAGGSAGRLLDSAESRSAV